MTESKKTFAIYTALGFGALLLVFLLGGCQGTAVRTPFGSVERDPAEAPIIEAAPTSISAARNEADLKSAQGGVEEEAETLARKRQDRESAERAEQERRRAEAEGCIAQAHRLSGVDDGELSAMVCDCLQDADQVESFRFKQLCGAPALVEPPKPAANSTPPVVLIDGVEFDKQVKQITGKDWSLRTAQEAVDEYPETLGVPRRRWKDLSAQCQNALAVAVEHLDRAVLRRVTDWVPLMAQNPRTTAQFLLRQKSFRDNLLDGGKEAWTLAADRCAQ